MAATTAAAPTAPSPAGHTHREDFRYERRIDGPLDDPGNQLKVQIHDGKLIVTINGDSETVDLPEDAFTTKAAADYRRRTLSVTVPRRDPNGPAMLEKKMFDPDTRPRDVAINFPKEGAAHRKMAANTDAETGTAGTQGPTPAQIEMGEHNPDMYGGASSGIVMPEANMGSTVATSNPVMFEKGGAVDTVSQGETVVAVPGSSEVRMAESHRVQRPTQEAAADVDETARRLAGGASLRQEAPVTGEQVLLFGQREEEVEREFGVQSPAGAEEGAAAGEGGGGTVLVDWADEKVGMERRERRAADFYPTTDSGRVEPISSMKQEGEACDVCQCNPCQCDKLRSTYRVPTEINAPEMKRSGKPHLHTRAKPTTGVNAHEARDFRMHAKPRPEHHGGIGARTADFEGNVPIEGRGSWEEVEARAAATGAKSYTHHTGGGEIPLNPDTGKGVPRGALGGGHTVG